MKVIYCKECESMVELVNAQIRTCECGKCGGKYHDPLCASVFPKNCVVFGIDNNTFGMAYKWYHLDSATDYRQYFFTGHFVNDHNNQIDFYNTIDEVKNIEYKLKYDESIIDRIKVQAPISLLPKKVIKSDNPQQYINVNIDSGELLERIKELEFENETLKRKLKGTNI